MEATAAELRSEFPRVRRVVFSGQMVTIKSREGEMRLTMNSPLHGCLIAAW